MRGPNADSFETRRKERRLQRGGDVDLPRAGWSGFFEFATSMSSEASKETLGHYQGILRTAISYTIIEAKKIGFFTEVPLGHWRSLWTIALRGVAGIAALLRSEMSV
jgi:hypothetical protein